MSRPAGSRRSADGSVIDRREPAGLSDHLLGLGRPPGQGWRSEVTTPDGRVFNPVIERRGYLFGIGGAPRCGGGQPPRGELFATYAAGLRDTFAGLFDLPMREAWMEANEIVECADVHWSYLRSSGQDTDTYHDRLGRGGIPAPDADRAYFLVSGSC